MGAISTGGKIEINWPTFSPANFNFDIKKPEVSSTSPTSVRNNGKLENLEHTDLTTTTNAAQTLQTIDAIKNTPRKTFGHDIDAPNSPVSTTTRIAEVVVAPLIEKQENLVTGEEK